MAHAAHHRHPAGSLDDLLDHAAGAQVVEDHALLAAEDILGDEGGDEVHRDDLALLIDEAGAVGVAIEGHTEVELPGADGLLELGQGGVMEGVGLVVGERAVDIAIKRHLVNGIGEGLALGDAHAVGVVDGQLRAAAKVHKGLDVLLVGRENVVRGAGAGGGRRGIESALGDNLLDVGDAADTRDRHRISAAELKAIPLGRIVRGGNHN